MRIRLRSKGSYKDGERRYVLEKLEKSKVIETRIIPKAVKLWEIMCPPNSTKTCPVRMRETWSNNNKKFAYHILCELSEQEKYEEKN